MTRQHRAIALAAAAGLVAAGSTGCGAGQQPPLFAMVGEPTGFRDLPVEEILRLAAEDMRSAQSLRLHGRFSVPNRSITLDLAIDTDGNCAGKVTDEDATGEIISGPDGTFIRGDQELWEQAAPGRAEAIMARLGDRWAKVSSSPDGDGFIPWCDLGGMVDALVEQLEDDGHDDEKGQAALVDGQSALRVGRDGGHEYIWVAVERPHYVLWSQRIGDPGDSVRFLDYDDPVDTTPPAEHEYVDLFAEAV